MNDKKPFWVVLSEFRKAANLKQEELAEVLGITASYVGMLETGGRGKQSPLSRDQVWKLILKMKLFPPQSDELLEAADLSSFRSEEEELEIQRRYPNLRELWIFARIIRDIDENWFKVVRNNIFDPKNPDRKVKYCYFTSDDDICRNLVRSLINDGVPEDVIEQNVECFLLPAELFLTNFAIYNPGRPNMYCCGGISEFGKGFRFYTNTESETARLYELLKKWKNRILGNQPIRMRDALNIQLVDGKKTDESLVKSRSHFTKEIK